MILFHNPATSLTCKNSKCLKVPILQNKKYSMHKTYELYEKEPIHIYIVRSGIDKNLQKGDMINMFYSKKM